MVAPDLTQRAVSGLSALLAAAPAQLMPWSSIASPAMAWLGSYTPDHIPHAIRKRMLRADHIAMGYRAITAPFFAISYRPEGGSPETKAFCAETFLEREIFPRFIETTLNACFFGAQTHEMIWGIEDEVVATIKASEPTSDRTLTWRRPYTLARLDDLDPELTEPYFDPGTRRFAGATFDGGPLIPADKLVHVVNEGFFQNWRGSSILDPAYNPWYWSNWIALNCMKYMQQKANPPVKGWGPDLDFWDETAASQGQTAAPGLQLLGSKVQALRDGGFIGLDGRRDDRGERIWDIEFMEDSKRVDQFMEVWRYLGTLELRAMGIPEKVLTQDHVTGSFAIADVQTDTFYGTLQRYLARLLIASTNKVLRRITTVQFGPRAPAPRLGSSELSRHGRDLMARLLEKSMKVPRRTSDGRVFTGDMLLDVEKALETNNLPRLRPEDVARPLDDPVIRMAMQAAGAAPKDAPPEVTTQEPASEPQPQGAAA